MAYVGTPIDTINQFQSLVGKRFSGDASTTAFTLDVAPTSTLDIEVFVENVRQDPNSAYSLSGTTLTFAAAPPSGTNNIYVVHQAKAVGTISPAAGTVNADSFDNTVISGHTALAESPAATDELLISDAGTVKRIDAQFFQNTPSFLAYVGDAQSFSNNTLALVQFNTELFDTNSNYDTSTYKFTPTVAGKYFFTCKIRFEVGSISGFNIRIEKNDETSSSTFPNSLIYNARVENYDTQILSGILEANGSTDNFRVRASQDSGGSVNISASFGSFFSAYRLIG
jgi:hypothetical protein